MARVKKGMNAHKRHKKILKQAKGFYGAKSKVFRAANPAVMRSLRSAYVGRKNKKVKVFCFPKIKQTLLNLLLNCQKMLIICQIRNHGLTN